MATKTQTNNDLNIVNNFISNNVITPAILHTVVDMVEGDILLTFEECQEVAEKVGDLVLPMVVWVAAVNLANTHVCEFWL